MDSPSFKAYKYIDNLCINYSDGSIDKISPTKSIHKVSYYKDKLSTELSDRKKHFSGKCFSSNPQKLRNRLSKMTMRYNTDFIKIK